MLLLGFGTNDLPLGTTHPHTTNTNARKHLLNALLGKIGNGEYPRLLLDLVLSSVPTTSKLSRSRNPKMALSPIRLQYVVYTEPCIGQAAFMGLGRVGADQWVPGSGFRIMRSGFWVMACGPGIRIPVSQFLVPDPWIWDFGV